MNKEIEYNMIIDVCEPKQIFKLAEEHKDLNPMTQDLRYFGAGDYVVGDVGDGYLIERKTWSDLIRSIKDKSIWHQLPKILHHDGFQSILLIEGYRSQALKYSKFSHDQLNGVLNSIALSWKIPIVYTTSKRATVGYLAKLIKMSDGSIEKGFHAIRTKGIKAKSLSYQQRYFLEGIEGIGSTKSTGLLKEGKRLIWVLENLINPNGRFCYKYINIRNYLSEKTIEHFDNLINHDFKEEDV